MANKYFLACNVRESVGAAFFSKDTQFQIHIVCTNSSNDNPLSMHIMRLIDYINTLYFLLIQVRELNTKEIHCQ